MRPSWLLALCLCACTTIVSRPGGRRGPTSDAHDAEGVILLNGQRTAVRWSDGDSFDFLDGPYQGEGSRLVGYNTLESYGPVHRWGDWSREELFTLAKQDSQFCAAREWECTTAGEPDAFKRVLVDCPGLALEMVREGRGLAYAVRGKPNPLVLDAMHQAQRRRRGLWAKGVPKELITALHSFDEPRDPKYRTSANRVLDTFTGEATLRRHTDTYELCQEVCRTSGDTFSCMVYVPYERRYQNQPPCLIGE